MASQSRWCASLRWMSAVFSALLNLPPFLFGRLNSPFFCFFKIRKAHRAPSSWQATDWLHLVTQHCVSYRNAGSASRPVPKVGRSPGCAQSRQPKEERPGMDRVEVETQALQLWSAGSKPAQQPKLCHLEPSFAPGSNPVTLLEHPKCRLIKPNTDSCVFKTCKLFCLTFFPCFILVCGSKLINVL